jgi:multidrug efflux system membrane fusion protein
MRLFPIVTALLVMAALYLFVFDRERIVEFANGTETSAQTEGTATAESVEPPVGEKTEETPVMSVVVQKSMAKSVDSGVLVRGRTEAARTIEVKAETTGRVISDPLRKGSVVSAGQVLCKLDPGTREIALIEAEARLPEAELLIPEAESRIPEAAARISEAQARLVEAQISQRAATQLSQGGFATETRVAGANAAVEAALAAVESAKAGVAAAQTGVKSARAAVQAAEAGIAAANKEIERLSIAAPFSGVLESDTAELGALLQPGMPCATVIQLDPIVLVGFIPETAVSKVEVGAFAKARLASGSSVTGIVTFLSRSADLETRTFRVEIEAENSDGTIRDGQTAEITISSGGQDAHLLPISALTLDDGGVIGVRTVNADNIVEFMPVTLMRDTAEGIWVGGLPEAADVIVVGQEYVTEGVKVAVTYRELLQ